MGAFEKEAISTAPDSPTFWRRFVEDTFVINQKAKEDSFFNHINSIDNKIQFTKEASRSDGSMPFLYTLVTINGDGSLNTKVYRKPTHTDLYLQWDSHHSIAAKIQCDKYPTSQGKSCEFKQPAPERGRRSPPGSPDKKQIPTLGPEQG